MLSIPGPRFIRAQDLGDPASWQILDYARLGLEYWAGHLPGALPIEKSLVWQEVEGVAGMLPPAELLTRLLTQKGLDDRRPTLVYDGTNGLYAARLAWALLVAGWDEVAILAGGLNAWRKAGGAVELGGGPKAGPGSVRPRWRGELYATWQEVLNRPAGTVLLDTRSRAEYEGREKRAARGGRIPGCVFWEWKNALDEKDEGLRPDAEIEAELRALGLGPEVPVITYCQSGVRASHTLAVFWRLGWRKVRVYDGSWEEWGNRPDLPLEAEA